MANDLANVAGRPIVIGTTVATPMQDGKVKLQDSKSGATATVEMEDFKNYLIANAPKAPQGDSVSFSGKTSEGAEEAAEDKKSGAGTALKVVGGLALVGVAIWKRKEIGEYAKKAIDYLKGKFGNGAKDTAAADTLEHAKKAEYELVPTSVNNGIKNTSVKIPTTGDGLSNEQVFNTIENIETKHVNANTRKAVNTDSLVSKEQQAAYNKDVAYQAPTEQQAAAIVKNNEKAAEATAESRHVQNNVSEKSGKALETAKANMTDPVAGNTRKLVGELPGGKNYVIDLLDGKPTCILNGEGKLITDEKAMAKYIGNKNIDLNAKSL